MFGQVSGFCVLLNCFYFARDEWTTSSAAPATEWKCSGNPPGGKLLMNQCTAIPEGRVSDE